MSLQARMGRICAAGILQLALGCAGDPGASALSQPAGLPAIEEGHPAALAAAEAPALAPLVIDTENPLRLEPARDETARDPPPLVIEADAPLLEGEESGEEGAPPQEKSVYLEANEACFVCHANYRGESLVTQHAAESIGCVECHGGSFAHRNDENNTTPPDRMYPPDAIDGACRMCHKVHKARPADVIARWLERCPETTDAASIVCTGCHGDHRLDRRIVRWNKRTRELISAD